MIAAPEFGDAEELLRQYSPSQWSKRIFASSDAVVMDHLKTLGEGSKAVLEEAMVKQSFLQGLGADFIPIRNMKTLPPEIFLFFLFIFFLFFLK